MSSFFGKKPDGPAKLNGVQTNQSVQGFPLAVVMGRGKVQQALLWVDGFASRQVNTGGGGKGAPGGKNSATELRYSADVIAALCSGPIRGIGDVWSAQSWLSNSYRQIEYTIPTDTPYPYYTPPSVSSVTADGGVSVPVTLSGSFSDVGAVDPTTVGAASRTSFSRVAYGTALAAGQYAVDPATGRYYFAAANAGLTVTLNLSYSLSTIKQQTTTLIPSGLTVAVGGSIIFAGDGGVVYKTGPNDGVPLSYVPGGGGPGTYSFAGSGPCTYTFDAADEGAEVELSFFLDNSAAIPAGTSTSLSFIAFEGYPGQDPWALLSAGFPGADLGYSGIAYVAYGPMDLGSGAQIQQNAFEVFTADAWGGGVGDCNPVRCIREVLTNPVWGLGAGAVPFPLDVIDDGTGGTWGDSTPNWLARQDNTAVSWFAAHSFFISPVIDRQDSAASLISRWLEAGACAAFMSEGLLKLVPYGDTTAAGNGCIWTAPDTYAADLDDADFVAGSSEDPVKISSTPWQDAYNVVQVTWNNRASQYSPEVTPQKDQAAINRYGSRVEDPQSYEFITTLPAATFAASMRVKRNVYTRNAFEFTLPYRYSFLDAMDVVLITTSSAWSLSNALGVVKRPVRITKIEDNPDGTLGITAEDYSFGLHKPSLYSKATGTPTTTPNLYDAPGDTSVVLYGATNAQTGYKGNEIWIGAIGDSATWGGCNVYASMDDATYRQIGEIKTPARLGSLPAAFAAGSDPDTVNSLVVELANNCAGLESGTHADADINNTLCFVGGELVSYSDCALSGDNQYTASGYIRRGVLGSPVLAHDIGDLFLRIDDAVFRYEYSPDWAGKTIYLKFQSYNAFGNAAQDLSTLTAVSFDVPPQAIAGAIDPTTGALTFTRIGTAPSSPSKGGGRVPGYLPY